LFHPLCGGTDHLTALLKGVPKQSSGTRLEIVSKKMADPIAQASHFDFQIV